ncbi:MAG: serine hydrolase [Acidimicrobiales bacterium]|jgi:CubicO group peptidase (beta-lactamase class C family)
MTDVAGLVDELFGAPERYGETYAGLIVQGDRTLVERYGGSLPNLTGPPQIVDPDTKLLSWSMAKSVLHTAIGVLVDAGRLDPEAPAPVAEWSDPDDPRHAITLRHLLRMRDGLQFVEDYVEGSTSDTIEMLYGTGKDDVAHYAAERPLAHPPGTVFNYSSGTANIVARILGNEVGLGDDTLRFLHESVFEPIGMPSATAQVDAAGTFIGSSYVYATARDWARFGQCYVRGGVGADGVQVVSEEWVDQGLQKISIDPTDGHPYGELWWVLDGIPYDTFYASGFQGQRVVVCPRLDLVIVRFGASQEEHYEALLDWCRRVIEKQAADVPGASAS